MDQTTAPSFPIIQVVEISNRCDVIESVAAFAQSHGRGVCILSAKGTVTNVTLRLPGTTSESFILVGDFEIVSLSGCFLPTPTPHAVNGLSIHVAIDGGFRQVAGGSLLGGVVAAGGPPVVMMALSFSDAVYERVIPANHLSQFHDGLIMSHENPLQLPHDYSGGNVGGGSGHGGGQPF